MVYFSLTYLKNISGSSSSLGSSYFGGFSEGKTES
jgi:hypothetical protein